MPRPFTVHVPGQVKVMFPPSMTIWLCPAVSVMLLLAWMRTSSVVLCTVSSCSDQICCASVWARTLRAALAVMALMPPKWV
nr:hypothetical protein [Pseudomonas pharmacofabricae]